VSPAGPAVCVASAGAPFVTPAQAEAAMTALWNAQELAYVKRDAAELNELDTGTRLLEDHYALDSLVCKCSTWYWTKGPRTLQNLTLYYPRQSRYPLYFLAQIAAAAPGQSVAATAATAEFFVTRSSPSTPWKIATQLWDTGYATGGQGLPAPALDTDGFDTPPPPAVAAAAATWPRQLAAFYTTLKDTGRPPATPFAPGPLTTGTDLAARPQGWKKDGAVSHYAFAAGNDPWLVEDTNGTVYSCADVLENEVIRPAKANTVLVQKDGPGDAWGPDLDTGYYAKVITTFEWPVCIYQDPSGALAVVGPLSGSYPIHDGGVPAKLPNSLNTRK
jgi:hypothetical protein